MWASAAPLALSTLGGVGVCSVVVVLPTVQAEFGMALGGWMSCAVFDLTGSYKAAFVNGLLWNLRNMSIAGWLLWRSGFRHARA